MKPQSTFFALTLLFCFGLNTSLYAQYEKGTILTLFGDTIHCRIKHPKYISSKTEFRYQLDSMDRDLFINSKDVFMIFFNNEQYECLETETGIEKGMVYAYKLELDGNLRLYSKPGTGSVGVMNINEESKTGGQKKEVLVYFLKKSGLPLYNFSQRGLRKLPDYLSDCPELIKKLNTPGYNEVDIAKIIREYNECTEK